MWKTRGRDQNRKNFFHARMMVSLAYRGPADVSCSGLDKEYKLAPPNVDVDIFRNR